MPRQINALVDTNRVIVPVLIYYKIRRKYFQTMFEFLFYTTPREQLCMERILDYINSPELVNHNSKNDMEINNQKYDYKGLNELYKEALECFKFNLIAIKEFVDNQEVISGLSLQRKKVK